MDAAMTSECSQDSYQYTRFISDDKTPIYLDKYQEFTRRTDKNPRPGVEGLVFALLGLYGETGSLLSELKKKQRDKESYTAYHSAVMEEFGDVLWYFSNVASKINLSLSDIAQKANKRLTTWSSASASHALTFFELQSRENVSEEPGISQLEPQLILLAGKTGNLLEDFSLGRLGSNRDLFSGHMIEIFRALIKSANGGGLNLNEIARLNINKVFDRWPLEKIWGRFFDEGFDENEQLPRQLSISFLEKEIGNKKFVLQKCNGINIGDRVTDNRLPEDYYRYHDVFHLSYAAVLGWSPVLRALFKLKRKSVPVVDENQDGARAILIEEGISTWIFNHGMRHNNFENISNLDYTLLKAVKELVKGYEVEERPIWQWEQAILEGFTVFRQLCDNRGGIVNANLCNHTLTYSVLP
jgi:NTP pyrophosphatase (non-canonical NTP hydrolase)